MLRKFIKIIGGDPDQRELERLSEVVNEINALEPQYEALSDSDLAAKTVEFRQRLSDQAQDYDDPQELAQAVKDSLDELMVEAFAAVREASKRTIGLRHYDVQLIGGMVLHSGKIAEMRTGEGKTLVATLPLYLNALAGRGAHLITVNDYLARRDARWMAPIYNLLGMSVGVLQMAARTENGKRAFLVDLQQRSPHEDQDQLQMVWRKEAYSADITYGTNSEFGFDYLRDNMTMRLDERVQRGHYFAIVDEVDNVLIDEARTPLIISGPAQDEAENYVRTAQVVRQLRPEDYEVSEKDRSVTLTEVGESHVEEILGLPLRDPDRPEDITIEQARMLGYLEQALRAQYLYRRNKDYLVQARKVIIIDEFTGRMMPGRRWSDGLHQAVEAKEGVPVQSESVTYATITIQNYFRMYQKLAGMTGTAMTESEEFFKIYKLNVLAIPTNLEYEASLPESDLALVDSRDQDGYKVSYYSKKDDPQQAPVFWKRKDYPDMVYRTEEMKIRTIAQEILQDHSLGRPVLVGTTSVELSERLSDRLKAEPLRRLALTAILRNAYLQKHNLMEEMRQIPELSFLGKPLEEVDIVAMRKLARDLDISFNPDERSNLLQLAEILQLPQEKLPRLEASLRGGIPNEVLNARKHTEESKIIARAGAFGSVTIATNMAGRGVDIKLGGELPEEIGSVVNRILERSGFDQAYSMTMEEKQHALEGLEAAAVGIYEEQVQAFKAYLSEMEQVKALGGLHVIGSERHEARRIDNQLRGRSARQGDPGSSRFYLSMEDQLMRLFGGQQADALMQRMKIDDSLPIESGLVGRLVEQAQTSVEGANFDVRKHLLEYDDVLNAQRLSIYGQRDRIFTKPDITDDVLEMLREEVLRRVPEALSDQGGAWKLLAWLDQVQPALVTNGKIYPPYSLKLVLEQALNLPAEAGASQVKTALLEVARQSIQAEKEHLLDSVKTLLSQAYERMHAQIEERQETIDNFFESLEDAEEEEPPQRPAEMLKQLSDTVGMSLRLSPEALRQLREQPETAQEELHQQVEQSMVEGARLRLVGSIERRLNEELGLNASQLQGANWDDLEAAVLQAVAQLFDRRSERYLQPGGQIERELESSLGRLAQPASEQALLSLLLRMPQGAQSAFDKRTHKRVLLQTTRLTFTFYAASFLEGLDHRQVADSVLEHLEIAQEGMCSSWGAAELQRLGSVTVASLDVQLRTAIQVRLDSPENGWLSTPLADLPGEARQSISDELGRNALSGIYRQLLLSVIGQLWVDYLTQMESLRISIGLEAYGQRDPLVQYKSRASELFQNLLSSMRLEMVNRMFTYRPRDLSSVQASTAALEQPVMEELAAGEDPAVESEESEAEVMQPAVTPSAESRAKGKRKRHRKR